MDIYTNIAAVLVIFLSSQCYIAGIYAIYTGSASEGEGDKTVLVTQHPEEKPSCLVPELLCEYMKIPATQTDVTLMAKIRAMAQVSEERRAPVTICAAIDRRFASTHSST